MIISIFLGLRVKQKWSVLVGASFWQEIRQCEYNTIEDIMHYIVYLHILSFLITVSIFGIPLYHIAIRFTLGNYLFCYGYINWILHSQIQVNPWKYFVQTNLLLPWAWSQFCWISILWTMMLVSVVLKSQNFLCFSVQTKENKPTT